MRGFRGASTRYELWPMDRNRLHALLITLAVSGLIAAAIWLFFDRTIPFRLSSCLRWADNG
jgi:hypothetical protein